MSDVKPPGSPPDHPTWRDYEALVSRLSQVIRANTGTLKLIDAKEVSNARALTEVQTIASRLRDSSVAGADRLADKIDVLIDLARDSRADMRQALSELRASNDKLGVTREEIAELKLSDRFTPTHVPLPKPEETRTSPPEGVTVRHGKVIGVFGVASIGRGLKKLAPWLATTGIGAAVSHLLHRLHLFGL